MGAGDILGSLKDEKSEVVSYLLGDVFSIFS